MSYDPEKRRGYMREYTRKNAESLNERRRARYAALSDIEREQCKQRRSERYAERHKERGRRARVAVPRPGKGRQFHRIKYKLARAMGIRTAAVPLGLVDARLALIAVKRALKSVGSRAEPSQK